VPVDRAAENVRSFPTFTPEANSVLAWASVASPCSAGVLVGNSVAEDYAATATARRNGSKPYPHCRFFVKFCVDR